MKLDPLIVRELRIYLAQNELITWTLLADFSGYDLIKYLITQPRFPEPEGLHWRCRDPAKWMREHPKLIDLYVQGKAIKNSSGRTCEINQGYQPGRI